MPRKGKPTGPAKRVPRVAAIIRANTEALFDLAGRVDELADRANPVLLAAYIKERNYGDTVSKSHLYRMLDGRQAVGADVLDLVARAFGLEAWHMLVPGMEPANPPSVLVSEAQRALFRSLTTSYREIAKTEESDAAEETAAGTVGARSDRTRAPPRGRDNGRSDPPRRPTAKAKQAKAKT